MLNTPYGPAEVVRIQFAGSNGCWFKVRFKSGQTDSFRHEYINWGPKA